MFFGVGKGESSSNQKCPDSEYTFPYQEFVGASSNFYYNLTYILMLLMWYFRSRFSYFDEVFCHLEEELSRTDEIIVSSKLVTLKFRPILFVADLIGKAKILKMKQCNGFYGCTLCTLRGQHFAGSQHYPHDQDFEMRSFEKHIQNLEALENGSIESYRAKYGRKVDAERKTQGVKGRRKLLAVVSNLPLTAPVDVMHQLFLGVAKDLLTFFYEGMRPERRQKLNAFLSDIDLPRELENTVRKLDSLVSFKAKELKTRLLYLSPIVFPSLMCGENKLSDSEDLKNWFLQSENCLTALQTQIFVMCS